MSASQKVQVHPRALASPNLQVSSESTFVSFKPSSCSQSHSQKPCWCPAPTPNPSQRVLLSDQTTNTSSAPALAPNPKVHNRQGAPRAVGYSHERVVEQRPAPRSLQGVVDQSLDAPVLGVVPLDWAAQGGLGQEPDALRGPPLPLFAATALQQ